MLSYSFNNQTGLNMNQKDLEKLTDELEDFCFEIRRLVSDGFPITDESIGVIKMIHPALDRISEDLCEAEYAYKEEKDSLAYENNRMDMDASQSVRSVL